MVGGRDIAVSRLPPNSYHLPPAERGRAVKLTLKKEVYDAMLAAAQKGAPLEACGLLVGTGAVGLKVTLLHRYRRESRAESERQAQQRTMKIEFARHFVFADELDCRADLLHQFTQRPLHRYNYLCSSRLRKLAVPAKFYRIAEPLLGMD